MSLCFLPRDRYVRVRLSPVADERLVWREEFDPDFDVVLVQGFVRVEDVEPEVDEVEVYGSVPTDSLRRSIVAEARLVTGWFLNAEETRRLFEAASTWNLQLRGCEIPPDLSREPLTLLVQNCRGMEGANKLSPGNLSLCAPFQERLSDSICRSTHNLFLRGGPGPLGPFDLGQLTEMPRLSALYLSDVWLKNEGLTSICCAPVETIGLYKVYFQEDDDLALAENTRLKNLRLTYTEFSEEAFVKILRAAPSLKYLNCVVTHLSSELVSSFANHPSLESIEMDNLATFGVQGTVAPNIKEVRAISNVPRVEARLRRVFPNADVSSTGRA